MEISLELAERITDTIDKNIPEIVIYAIDSLKMHYDENLELLRNQFVIADKCVADGNVEAAKTIWRTQIVLLASAMDYFMHEVIWYGLDQIYEGDWERTSGYNRITITFEQLQRIKEDPEDKGWFWDYITDEYKKQTLMSFDDIKRHLKIIGIEIRSVADRAFFEKNGTVPTVDRLKETLNSLYWRRNHIAHQSDRSERNAERKDITKEYVEDFISKINNIVDAVIEEMKNKNVM